MPGPAHVRHLGLLVDVPADAVTHQLTDDAVARALDRLDDGRADVADVVARHRGFDGGLQRLLRDLEQRRRLARRSRPPETSRPSPSTSRRAGRRRPRRRCPRRPGPASAAGMPCTTSSLTETHTLPGKPYRPLKAGTAPRGRRCTPRRTRPARPVRDARRDAARQLLEQPRDDGAPSPDLLDLLGRPEVDHAQSSTAALKSAYTSSTDRSPRTLHSGASCLVVRDERRRLLAVDLEPARTVSGVVVRAVDQRPSATVTHALVPGRIEVDVVDRPAVGAAPTPAQSLHERLVGRLEEDHAVDLPPNCPAPRPARRPGPWCGETRRRGPPSRRRCPARCSRTRSRIRSSGTSSPASM